MALREIRIHGRGGQGAVTSSQVLAIAAFHDGKFCQAFPNFGIERAGAPVESYVRIDEKPINVRQQVYEPDYVIVLDSALLGLVNVAAGIKKNGLIIINSAKSEKELMQKTGGNFSIRSINITKIALQVIGKPFVNIASLGAFCALTKQVSLNALNKAIEQHFALTGKKAVAELNKKAAAAVAAACKK